MVLGLRGGSNNLCGSQMGHEEKQECVRGDVQIEIDQAMNKETDTSDKPGELEGSRKGVIVLAQTLERFAEQGAEKPGATESAEYASLGKGLKVIVVSMIDDLPIVE